ncbi:hypothetical protein Trydic_g8519 [Trypoxylus dichotomus]
MQGSPEWRLQASKKISRSSQRAPSKKTLENDGPSPEGSNQPTEAEAPLVRGPGKRQHRSEDASGDVWRNIDAYLLDIMTYKSGNMYCQYRLRS